MRALRPGEYGRIYGVTIKRRRKRKEKLQHIVLGLEELKTAIDLRVLYLKEGVDDDCVVYAEQRERTFRGRFSVTRDFENDDAIVGLCINGLERLEGKDVWERTKKQVHYTIYRRKEDPPSEAGVEYSLLEAIVEEHDEVYQIKTVLE